MENFKTVKIKSIRLVGQGHVRNLTVNRNHTFLTANGIVTHNCDLASNKIMCIQSVIEGKGVFIKKIGKNAHPAPGFNIFATANTKGKGSEDGRFIGTNVLNEAFLDRFAVTLEQSYPTNSVEKKILEKLAHSLGVTDATEFIGKLCDWADTIRRTFFDGGIDEIISTRRLTHILRAYCIFKNKEKAIRYCINRFDDETKTAFIELYDKIDADFKKDEEEHPLDISLEA
jgi:hypothetical protein